jgi:predicted metal-dependent hydrolase
MGADLSPAAAPAATAGGALTVGQTTIPYALRPSARARALKVVVTPQGVEVVVPEGTLTAEVDALLAAKRRWIFDAVRALAAAHQPLLDQRYASGAKLQVRGRWLMLDVRPGPVEAARITCRSKLHVVVPEALDPAARPEAVAAAFRAWLRARAEVDLQRLGPPFAAALGVEPAGYRLTDAQGRWGACGRDGVIRVHWQLVQAPLAAFAYVVAHELAHLRHRHHGPEFWEALGHALPDWAERKALLERWEVERRAV